VRAWFIALMLVAAAGCVTRVPLATNYAGPEAWPAGSESAAVPDPDALPLVASAEQEKERGGFTVRDLNIPSGVEGHAPIQFEYYDVDGGERTPVVVLLPIFNGQLSITRFFARYFANQGWAAIVVVRGRDALDSLRAPEEAIRSNLHDYRRVLDWAEQQREIDAGRIGLFGISFGAMDAVMLTALDRRIDALVVAMAGGDLPYVMMNTHYRPVARTVEDLLAEPGMNRAALRLSLDEIIVTDPLALAPYVDAERVLMIMTRTDAIVPFEAQEALRASMGDPETLYLPTGHRTSIVFFPKVRSSAYEFFARQFVASRPALAAN
jgi:pimeloyl-ACP methyl ester carboxylesterase